MDVVEVLTWDQARLSVQKVSPKLAVIIDQISPDKRHDFIKVRYPFGSHVLRAGNFDLSIIKDEKIREKLQYDDFPNPVMLVLQHSFELFAPQQDRIIPYYILQPGQLFGIWQLLNKNMANKQTYFPYSIWDMTAGARSVFMLPKISEKSAHNKLQHEFKIQVDKPRDFKDHWQVFKALSQSKQFNQNWTADVLYFSREWFKNLDDPAFHAFKIYIYECIWRQSELWRGQIFWDLTFSRIHANRQISASPYHIDVARHIMAIAAGSVPGFTPAIDDQMGPFSHLQEIYQQHYDSISCAPTIMQPAMFSMYKESRSVYYSLQFPSAIRMAVKPSKRDSVISDTFNVSNLIRKYILEISNYDYSIKATNLEDIPRKVNFSYYHTQENDYSCVHMSHEIPRQDQHFLSNESSIDSFPKNSAFFTGCIKISSDK